MEPPMMNQQNRKTSAPGNNWRDIKCLRPQNRRALALLQDWLAEPDDLGAEWWDTFERELSQHRFSLHTLE